MAKHCARFTFFSPKFDLGQKQGKVQHRVKYLQVKLQPNELEALQNTPSRSLQRPRLEHSEPQGAVQADCLMGVGSKREGRGVGW